jgi:hypothetical protein
MWKLISLGPQVHHLDRSEINRFVHAALVDIESQSSCHRPTISSVTSDLEHSNPAFFALMMRFLPEHIDACPALGHV